MSDSEIKDTEICHLPRAFTVRSLKRDDGSYGIDFASGDLAANDKMISLISRVESTITTLRVIYPTSNNTYTVRHSDFFRSIVGLSELGMYGKDTAIDLAHQSLTDLHEQVLTLEAPRIKNAYMLRLGRWATGMALATTAIGFMAPILADYISFDNTIFGSTFIPFPMLALVCSGSCIGAWASFAIRKPKFRFDDLSRIEEDHLNPPIRLMFCAVLTSIIALFICSGAFDIIIGNFHASNMKTSGSSALLVGLICGISEMALPSLVSQRAGSFTSAIKS